MELEPKVFNIVDALLSLVGDAGWSTADDVAIYSDENIIQPTHLEIETEISRLQVEYDGLLYSRLRKAEYDKLNQDEMRYDDMINDTNTWGEAIELIKAQFPKEG